MNRDEIVAALRGCAEQEGCMDCPRLYAEAGECATNAIFAAADLIENQQNHIAALMKANDSLKDTIARRDAQIEDMKQGMAQLTKAVAVKEGDELHAMKNELCQYCGKYKQAHEGACDGCRWREK